jgi:hypothetical protein
MDANTILIAITLAVSGWTLTEVINLKVRVGIMRQKISDLPCEGCDSKKNRQKLNYEQRSTQLPGPVRA